MISTACISGGDNKGVLSGGSRIGESKQRKNGGEKAAAEKRRQATAKSMAKLAKRRGNRSVSWRNANIAGGASWYHRGGENHPALVKSQRSVSRL